MPVRSKVGCWIWIGLLAAAVQAAETTPPSFVDSDAQHRCAMLKEQTGAALGEPSARILTATLNPRSTPTVEQ